MPDSLDEEKLRAALAETRREVQASDRGDLETELTFEAHMFLGRLELLRARAQGREGELIRPETLRENLYDFLRDDLIEFLQKILAGKVVHSDLPDLQPLHRAIIQILKELGVYVYFPAGKDFRRTTILERWTMALNREQGLTLRKIINYFDLYTTRLYSLLDQAPAGHEDLRSVVRRMLESEEYEVQFDEIYEAEMVLRDEIQFALLRSISAERRLEYLVQKEIVTNLSVAFITILHEEYGENYRRLLNEHEAREAALQQERDSLNTEVKLAGFMAQKQFQKKLPEGDERINFGLWYQPFMVVGGDYYRVLQIGDHEYAMLLADIAGHGLGAAMYVNTLRITFEDKRHYLHRPARMLKRVNEELYGKLGDNFLTAIYVYINLRKQEVRYCNAGHTKGFLYERGPRSRHVRFLRPNSKVIGVFQKTDFREGRVSFSGNWRMVLYTDGISETFNEQQEMLTERGLSRLFLGTDSLSPNETLEQVQLRVADFRGEAAVEDDRTMIVADLNVPTGS